MKVLFISEFDVEDPGARSGVPFYIARGLRMAGMNFTVLTVSDQRSIWQRIQSRVRQFICRVGVFGKRGFYEAGFSPSVANSYRKCWKGYDFSVFDVILSISPRTVAFLPPGPRLFLWIDNTFDTYAMYPGREGLCQRTFREANRVERQAFNRADRVYTASHWLARRLPETHGLSPQKISVLPRGANLPAWPDASRLEQALAQRMQDPVLRLIFVNSGNWMVGRKGGPMVVDTWQLLKGRMDVHLTIVGDIPPEVKDKLEADGCLCTGKINRATEAGESLYLSLLLRSHLLFVPSRADGFGIVYAEAAACGVPSLARAIMGVTEAVREDITGYLLPPEAAAEDFARVIERFWENKPHYPDVSNRARAYATKHFCWEENVKEIIKPEGLPVA